MTIAPRFAPFASTCSHMRWMSSSSVVTTLYAGLGRDDDFLRRFFPGGVDGDVDLAELAGELGR